ncbi:small ribosomal subunit Rsm22 family protein [Fundidesulfovibrio terrae]|uniref:small ribosomal subunit Rsm22 family protein n=1 Tax=Fundidesulfovibrio terrae TaxID=2922866 RepID=UPI001FAF429A|nr:small ribosomal subunit Rsm22 family protein [Fundidesulfovibrio terrae]
MSGDQAGQILRAAPLFPRPSGPLVAALAGYRKALEAVHPLKPKHRAGLPGDVKRLSLALTAERGPGPQANYLASPANLSAYLYYFLPWNLYRLSRLFTGLDFDIPDGATVLDLGSGPLTLAQALWISRPRLRTRKLRFLCVDQTGQALRAGRDLFEALTGEEGRAWTIELIQAPAHKAPQEPCDVVMAANALNELSRGRGEEGHEALERICEMLLSRLDREGRLMLVEPGTRLGGKLLSRLRDLIIEEGVSPLAPCTHAEPCPMLAPRWRSWCHFVFPAEGVPDWLASITKQAELDKDRASLSFLHMSAGEPVYDPARYRTVSHRFALPTGLGAYACGAEGLRLMSFPRAPRGLVPGALLDAKFPAPDKRDSKSGAWLTPVAPEPEGQGR